MTQQEKQQYSIKFVLQIISLAAIWGSMFASYKVNEYRIDRVESSFKEHCTWGNDQSKVITKGQEENTLRLVRIESDLTHVKSDVAEIKEEIKSQRNGE